MHKKVAVTGNTAVGAIYMCTKKKDVRLTVKSEVQQRVKSHNDILQHSISQCIFSL